MTLGQNIPHIGMRTVKTAVAVMVSYVIFAPSGLLYNESYPGVLGYIGPLYACIAGIVCMQNTVEQTLKSGLSRFLGVLIGAVLGLFLLVIEPFLHHWALTAAMLGLVCVAGIWVCTLLKWPNACVMACIVPCVMVIAGNVPGGERFYYGLARVVETLTGAGVALIINTLLPTCALVQEAPEDAPAGGSEGETDGRERMEPDRAAQPGLHDYRLAGMSVDYPAGEIRLGLRSPQGGTEYTMVIRRFQSFSASRELPWGEGVYISSSTIQRMDENSCLLELELNSGDRIAVRYAG